MFGGINFKQLSERFNESLHDLESTLSQAAALPAAANASTAGSQPNSPARQQPTRAATSPAPSTSSPSRSRPARPSIETQKAQSSQSASASTPLSPTSLAQASQSASQLADSALSSLRASLRKGRQSLESAAAAGRSSLDATVASAATSKSPAEDTPNVQPQAEPVEEEAGASEQANRDKEPASEAKATVEPELLVDVSTDETVGSTSAETDPVAAPLEVPKDAAVTIEEAAASSDTADLVDTAAAPTDSVKVVESSKETPVAPVKSDLDDPLSSSSPSALAPAREPQPAVAASAPASSLTTQKAAAGDDNASMSAPDAMAGDDDADDWGMGSISPAPESEAAVEPVAEEPSVEAATPGTTTTTETADAGTSGAVGEELAVPGEATKTADDASLAPSDPGQTAVLPDEPSEEAEAAATPLDALVPPGENGDGDHVRPSAENETPLLSLDDSDKRPHLPAAATGETPNDKVPAGTADATPSASATSTTAPVIPEKLATVADASDAVSSPAVDATPSVEDPSNGRPSELLSARPDSDATPAGEDLAAAQDPQRPIAPSEPNSASATELVVENDATQPAPPTVDAAEEATVSADAIDSAAEEPGPASVPAPASVEAVALDVETPANVVVDAPVPQPADTVEPVTSNAAGAGESEATKELALPPSLSSSEEEKPTLDEPASAPPVSDAPPVTSETKGAAASEPELEAEAIARPAAPITTRTDDLSAPNVPEKLEAIVDAKTGP